MALLPIVGKSSNETYNAKALICKGVKMKKKQDWFDRLVALIENDGRSMSELSKLSGCGQNYIQQMINGGRRPSVDKLLDILDTLGGGASTVYVILGHRISEEDLKLLSFLSQRDQKKIEALKLLLDPLDH